MGMRTTLAARMRNLAAAALLSALLAACGGSGDAQTTAASTNAEAVAGSAAVSNDPARADIEAIVTTGATVGILDHDSNRLGTPVDLSAAGGSDWVHWGDGNPGIVRKTGGGNQIPNFLRIGSGPTAAYTNDPRKFVWNDGTPTANGNFVQSGLYTSGIGNGFQVNVPAGTTARTVKFYVGGWSSGATLRAHMSDNSSADFVETTSAVAGQYNATYIITFRAGSANQTLQLSWVQASGSGNVTLNAVALSGAQQTTGPTLNGSVGSSTSTATISTIGTSDWVHWGDGLPGTVRKSGVTALIPASYQVVGGTAHTYGNDPRALAWTGGTPIASASGNRNGVYVAGVGNGFTLSLIADTTPRTVTVWVGGWNSAGTFRARLTDGSAADFVNTTAAGAGQYVRTYTLTYRAASANQRLALTWLQASGNGNVTINAVALAGGGASGGGSNQPPVAVIDTPANGTTFIAGQTIAFSGSASDPEDGALPNAKLTWWADLHHDTHNHPFVPPTTGGSGTASIPTSGETSSNIWYRFHLKATDSQGVESEVIRDIFPVKANVTLATVPTGLQLTLDGQPHTAQYTFTGVAGIVRQLGAADQVANGRRYKFVSWSDGGAATHTISTPTAARTYTAQFQDIGAATNNPPSVALSAPSSATVGRAVTLTATASDSDGNVTRVDFFDGATQVGSASAAPYATSWTPQSAGTHTLTARAVDNGGATATSAGVNVSVTSGSTGDTTPPSISLTAPSNLLSGISGTLTMSATASDNVGVASVEFQVDGLTIGSLDTAAPYTTTVNADSYASGQHVVRARARDAAGNVSGWATATVSFGGSRAQPSGFTLNENWVTGLAAATAMAQAPDGRFFIAEQQSGRVRIVKNGQVLATPFVTLSGVDSSGERGVIGVVLHPNFANNGWVYVYYTSTAGGSHNRISRFTASGDVAGGETILVNLPNLSTATNHNGGAMHFGADGKLYVGVGDNANGTNAQSLSVPFGKMLRFNDDGSIPTDNPFYGSTTDLARAIWAYGLRNPFTFAFNGANGQMFINDVGQDTWEEINVGARGANYGWPGSEGKTTIGGYTSPVFTYPHSANASGPGGFFYGYCIIGGAFYPTSGNFPATYRGTYFFADYVNGWIGRLDPANGYAAYSFGRVSAANAPVSMLVGNDGALYLLGRSNITRVSVAGS